MKLTAKQLTELIDLSQSTQPDAIGCDDCAALLDQFAQAELDGMPLPQALEVVRNHLAQCRCCRDEFAALMTALRAIADE